MLQQDKRCLWMLIFSVIFAQISTDILAEVICWYKNVPTPASFHLFSSFQTTLQILQQLNVKKCPSSIRCWDSNSRPLEHESPPITTRPGLPPETFFSKVCKWVCPCSPKWAVTTLLYIKRYFYFCENEAAKDALLYRVLDLAQVTENFLKEFRSQV